ncbi:MULTISPECIES: hypothetical protein [Gordonia]|uniref:hypothetical protein n=1 Tax=Gordonia sp. 852002-51296_SCH5728562-b TaxID=1834101 RepID=UPI000A5F24A3|nr:hypothetical protein [Gordonia sp. 852002-51296_SCH5728562-b]
MSIPTPTPTNHDPNRGRFSELRQSGGYRGTTLMLSLLVLVMLIVGAVFTAISARHDDAGDDPTSAGGSVSAPTASGAPREQASPPVTTLPDNAFGVPSTDSRGRRVDTPTNPLGQVLPQNGTRPKNSDDPTGAVPPPDGLMWQRVYGATIPFSTSDGPTAISADGVPSGFSHTPQGVVLAAWQIGQRATWAPDSQATALFKRAAVVSQAARPVVEQMESNQAQLSAAEPDLPPEMRDIPIAVRVTSYSDDFAHVEFAQGLTRTDGFTAASSALDMVWQDGDWKWVVPDKGQEPGQLLIGTSGDGWTPW